MSGELVIRDRAGCIRILAAFFLAGGLTFAGMLLGAATGPGPTGWGRVLAWIIALSHIGLGATFLFRTDGVTARLDHSERVITVRRSGLLRRSVRRIHLTEIMDVRTRCGHDSDGDTTWVLELRLRTGEIVPLHTVESHDEGEVRAACERLRAWGGGRLVFQRTGLTPAD